MIKIISVTFHHRLHMYNSSITCANAFLLNLNASYLSLFPDFNVFGYATNSLMISSTDKLNTLAADQNIRD